MFSIHTHGCGRQLASFAALTAVFLATSLSAQTPAAPAPVSLELHRALRLGDTAVWRARLAAGADLNTPDERGNTPLHIAALRNDADAVDALLARGADPKVLNEAGATALHYGTGSERIVTALLARGAAVDVASREEVTPLATAVARPESFAVAQRLLAAGADVNAGRKTGRRGGSSLLATAISGGDRKTIELIIERGADLNPDAGFSPLNTAAFMGDLETARLLLDRGAEINGNSTFAGPALNTSFYSGHTAITKLLIERGADLTVRSPRGHGTPPMVWSAYNEHGDPAIARLLLDRGLDANIANDQGETAYSFALKRGPDTPLVKLLREKGAKPPATTARPKAIPANDLPATPAARTAFVRDSVQRSLDLLQRGSTVFLDNGFVRTAKCISCHQQTLPGVAFGWARDRGLRVDEEALGRQLHAQLAMLAPRAEAARQMQEPVPDAAVSVGYSLDAFAAVHYAADETTDALVHYLLGIQRVDGSWPSFDRRPPMEDGPIVGTAWAARAVQLYPPLGRERDVATSLQRTRHWLTAQPTPSQNEQVFQLLGLAWAGESPATMRRFTRALIDRQKSDGGWSQLPGLDSDAWATGAALVALQKAGLAVSDRAYQRGTDYLLRTQFPDGSWWVRSRTWPFQPHFDGRFPHGKDQWISAGGTAWAAMALLLTLEPATPVAALPAGQELIATFLATTPSNPAPGAAATTATAPTAGSPNFLRDIKPLIERSCADCHGGEKKRGGFSLASRETLLKGGQSGDPAVVPGRSADSHLVRYISDQVEDLEMPPVDRREKYPALTAAEIARVRAWIDAGAPWE